MSRVVSLKPGTYKEDNSDSDNEYGLDIDNKNVISEGHHSLIIEKILGRKLIKDDGPMYELYFIKWKNMSYLHASWETREDLEAVDLQGKFKIKRFLQTPQAPGILGENNGMMITEENINDDEDKKDNIDQEEIDYFNPEYVDIQKVIACNTIDTSHRYAKKPSDLLQNSKLKRNKNKPNESSASLDISNDINNDIQYLIKWRGLPYNECSWERWSEIRSFYHEVFIFWQLQIPPKIAIKLIKFPTLQEYQMLEKSPLFGISKSYDEDGNTAESSTDENNQQDASSNSMEGLCLRDYQLEGVNWLLWNWWHKRSCILADEMGLGKTIQTVAFLHQLRFMSTTQISGPFLMIAPLSLVDQWQSELTTWSPQMNTVLLHGSAEAREMIIKYEFFYQEPYVNKADVTSLKRSNVCKFHILLTTFEVAMKEIRTLARIDWQVLIIDEAHKLKNQEAKLFSNLMTIPRKHCLLLTGTPLQNKTEELWALLNFADPERFHSLFDFIEKFGSLKDAVQVAQLHDMLKPYLLRRIKEDVEKSLPPKEETIVEVSLTTLQKKFYRAIYEKNTEFLFKGLKSSNQPSLMNIMMELRKCCNHPYLVKGVEERVISELTIEDRNKEDFLQQKLIEASGKFVLLDKLLPRLQSQGHKVLIFSQMVRVLNLLEDFLKYKNYTYERLDGSTKSADRKIAVSKFCKGGMQKFIMLMSTKAGGLGLNLTAADTVIIFDSDWNPQNDLQAQARAHRIGQTKSVMVYRLLTKKTYEMEMFHQASLKLGLDRAVLAHARNEQEDEEYGGIDGRNKSKLKYGMSSNSLTGEIIDGENNTSSTYKPSNMSTKEIDELLKRGAYDVFREDDTEQREFVEADIDTLLQRSSHKVTYENNGSMKMASTLGSFSKASFVSADEKEDVDINDPDFWKKAIGLNENTIGILDDHAESIEVLPYQRVRKQTRAYGDEFGVSLNENQIKEYLKPLKSNIKSNKPKSLAQEKRENSLKERIQREEMKQIKQAAELKARNDFMAWGIHTRDRILRALNLYGFGRWERIRFESGSSDRDPKSIEMFSRLYIYQCGLIAANHESNNRHDSAFVKDAINAAKQVDLLVKSGQQTMEIPCVLQEERFLTKLKQGQSKKSLNKLDVLSKLVNITQELIEAISKAREQSLDFSLDVDTLINQSEPPLSLEEQVKYLPLGDARPSWTRLRHWWDIECDKYLVIGIFKHGYGRFDLIKDDESLIFYHKLRQNISDGYINDDQCNNNNDQDVDDIDEGCGVYQDDDEDDDIGNEIVFQDHNQSSQGYTNGGIGGTMLNNSVVATTGGVPTLPDARALNRLFSWLVSSEIARMTKEELIEKKKLSNMGQDRQKSVKTALNNNDSNNLDDSSNNNETININNITEELILSKLNNIIEIDAISTVYKMQIQGIKKCENILKYTVSYQGDSLVPPMNNSDDTTIILTNKVVSAPSNIEEQSNENISLNNNNSSSSDNIIILDISSSDNNEIATTPTTTMSDYESTRLTALFILYGAPLQYKIKLQYKINHNDLVKKILKTIYGIDSNIIEDNKTLYNWDNVLEHAKINKTKQEIEDFYYLIWIPFCYSISNKRKSMSFSQNKYVVPNPYLTINEHHYAARGLCQLFLIRQQLLYATCYVLNENLDELMDYLKNNISGRNLENMPVWWCPWIHDVGILIGYLKYGYLSLSQIISDPELPFDKEYLENHIRQVFLYGSISIEPIIIDDIHTISNSEAFVQASLNQFPDFKDLEFRIMRILEDCTSNLSDNHPYKIHSYHILRNAPYAPTITINNNIITTTTKRSYRMNIINKNNSESDNDLDMNEENIYDKLLIKSDEEQFKLLPSISLKRFLRETYKRRKISLEETKNKCYNTVK